jgi:hypothetical protein
MRYVKTWLSAAGLVASLGLGGALTSASAQDQNDQMQQGQMQQGQMQQNEPSAAALQWTTASATVDKIDKKKRQVTLKFANGDHVKVKVPESVQGFDRLQKGDQVGITYAESVALALQPPGEPPPSAAATTQTGNLPGQRGAYKVETITATARITSVDPTQNKISFMGPNGEEQTVTVKDPTLQSRLSSLQPGQTVQVTYREAIAASISPPKPGA